jgi:hypothetical protein
MALSEKKIQEEMLKAERDRNKLLADIRDALYLRCVIAIGEIEIKARETPLGNPEAVKVYNKLTDALKETYACSDERWEE